MKLAFSNGILTLEFNTAGDLVIKTEGPTRSPASTFICGVKRANDNPLFCNDLLRIFTPLANSSTLPDGKEPFIWPTGKKLGINTPSQGHKIMLVASEQNHLVFGVIGQDRGMASFGELRIWPYGVNKTNPHGDIARASYLKRELVSLLALQP